MSAGRTDLHALSGLLREAKRVVDASVPRPVAHRSLMGLLGEARELSDRTGAERARPIGLIDHVACSGGTIVSRAVSLTANVMLLSEVDPFSEIHMDVLTQPFTPSDVIRLARNTVKAISDETVAAMFIGAMRALHHDLTLEGRTLVVRGHVHSRFFTGAFTDRPKVADLLTEIAAVRRIVTVRHPLESYISARNAGYLYFDPPSLSEYSRRYNLFLDGCKGLEIFKYEDLVVDPGAHLRAILKALGIESPLPPLELLEVVRVTGDSGRSGHVIARRPPKAVPGDLRSAVKRGKRYAYLCERLGYPLEPV